MEWGPVCFPQPLHATAEHFERGAGSAHLKLERAAGMDTVGRRANLHAERKLLVGHGLHYLVEVGAFELADEDVRRGPARMLDPLKAHPAVCLVESQLVGVHEQ